MNELVLNAIKWPALKKSQFPLNQKADYSSLLEILLILGMKGVTFHTFPQFIFNRLK